MVLDFGRKGHGKRHNMGSSKDHKGDIYNALVGAVNLLTASNVAVDTQAMNDAISAAIVGMQWQPPIIRFEAMVTNEPVAPSDGDRYISSEAGTIPSTTQAVLVDDVCEWDGTAGDWIISTPQDGWAVIEQGVDPNIAWWYNGSTWRKLGTIVDHANLLNLNWSVAAHVMDTDLDMNSHKVTELTDGTADTDAVAIGQFPGLIESCGLKEADITGLTGLTFNQQVDRLLISDSKGNDTTGDGSWFNPYKTLQKAITYGASIWDNFDIFLSAEFPGESVTVPANKNIRIFSYPNYETSGIAFTLQGTGTRLYLQNILADVDINSQTNLTLSMEGGRIDALTNGTPDLLEFKGTRMSQALWNTVKSMATGYGIVRDATPANNRVVIFQNTDMNGKKIVNMANGVAATDAATFGQLPLITFANQQNIYYVSGAKGDTIANGADGSQFNPLSTPNEAITLGAALDNITILVDYYNAGYDIIIPDNKNVSIFCLETYVSDAYINTIILGNSTYVQISNIYVDIIKESATCTGAFLVLANTFVTKLTDFAETGYATNVDVETNDAWFDTIAELLNASSYLGNAYDVSGSYYVLGELELNGSQIKNIGDGTLAQDAAAFGQIGSAIATHVGLPDPHTQYQKESEKDAVNGYAGLDAGGLINPSQLPAIAITNTFVVASQVAMLALSAQTGDVAIRTDLPDTYILQGTDPTVLGDWVLLEHPTDVVTSVFARTGPVTAQNGDYTASQITNVPAGDIAAVTVQAAIDELDSEKATPADITTDISTHAGLPSVHHAKYLDSEAVAAMGAKADGNPLNHDKYVNYKVWEESLPESTNATLVFSNKVLKAFVIPRATDYKVAFSTEISNSDAGKGTRVRLGLGLFAITGVNQGTKVFTIAGDFTSLFIAGRLLQIQGSTGNNGTYHVVSSALNVTDTDITVTEVIPSAVVDGDIYACIRVLVETIDKIENDEDYQEVSGFGIVNLPIAMSKNIYLCFASDTNGKTAFIRGAVVSMEEVV